MGHKRINIKHYQCVECLFERNNKDNIGKHMYENHEQHEENQGKAISAKL